MSRNIKYYYMLWVAQLISALGSGLSGYALSLWIYHMTGLVSKYSIISIITVLPGIILGPFAGVFVDMFSRKKVMLFCDTMCCIFTVLLAIMINSNDVKFGYLYILLSLVSIFASIRWSAYASSIILLVQGDMLKKANGLDQMVNALSQLFPPIVAVVLLNIIDIRGIIIIDFVTYLLSVTLISFIKIENKGIKLKDKTFSSFMKEFKFGLNFLYTYKVLFGLLIYMSLLNFITGSMSVLYTPFILSFASQEQLSLVMGFAGIGMIVGSIFISVAKKLKINTKTILNFSYLFLAAFIAIGLFESVILAAISGFVFFMCISIIGAVFQITFQNRVPVNLQGRVFSVRKMLITSTIPISYLTVGFLADYVTKPLLRENGILANSLGRIYGVGENKGIGLLIVLLGLLFILIINLIYKYFKIKELDNEVKNISQLPNEVEK